MEKALQAKYEGTLNLGNALLDVAVLIFFIFREAVVGRPVAFINS